MRAALGATHLIDASREDPVAAIRRLTGRGADFTFVAVGATRAVSQAIDALSPGGTCVLIGVPETGATIPLDVRPIVTGERVVRGSSYGSARTREDLPRLVNLYLAGKLRIDELINRRYGLDEANEAFRALAARRARARAHRLLMRELVFALEFRGRGEAVPGSATLRRARTTAPSQAFRTALGADGIQAGVEADRGRDRGARVPGGAIPRRQLRRGRHHHLWPRGPPHLRHGGPRPRGAKPAAGPGARHRDVAGDRRRGPAGRRPGPHHVQLHRHRATAR